VALVHGLGQPRRPVRAVVLGAGGFLGRALVAALRARGDTVVPLGAADIDLGDRAAAEALGARLRSDDTLVFLAAVTPDRGRDSAALMRNLEMGRAVTAAARAARVARTWEARSRALAHEERTHEALGA
jgi:nucleoside-diphosphate-sugar epimerase